MSWMMIKWPGYSVDHIGLDTRKPVFGVLRTTQAQTSLRIRAVWSAPLFIRVLESTISKRSTSKISVFKLVSVAEETGFSLAMSEAPKTGFVATRPNYHFSADSYSWEIWIPVDLNAYFSFSHDIIREPSRKMLTIAPERYAAGSCLDATVILRCIC